MKNVFPDIQKSRVEKDRAVSGLLDLPVVIVVLDIQDVGHPLAVRHIPLLQSPHHPEYHQGNSGMGVYSCEFFEGVKLPKFTNIPNFNPNTGG